MESESTIIRSISLREFCLSVTKEYAKTWPPPEGVLADKFARFFALGPFPSWPRLQQLTYELQIEVSKESLPMELAGAHCTYGGAGKIVVSSQELYLLSQEHTILHELREMVEASFVELGVPTSSGNKLERLADDFAVHVRIWGLDEELASEWQRIVEEQSWWECLGSA